jgi:hypothetical protein
VGERKRFSVEKMERATGIEPVTTSLGRPDGTLSIAGIKEIHRRFCELLPDDLFWIENPDTSARMLECLR